MKTKNIQNSSVREHMTKLRKKLNDIVIVSFLVGQEIKKLNNITQQLFIL